MLGLFMICSFAEDFNANVSRLHPRFPARVESRALGVDERAAGWPGRRLSCGGGLERCQKGWNAADRDGSLEIEAQDGQRQLCFSLYSSADEEPRVPHCPFHGAEWVLDQLAP